MGRTGPSEAHTGPGRASQGGAVRLRASRLSSQALDPRRWSETLIRDVDPRRWSETLTRDFDPQLGLEPHAPSSRLGLVGINGFPSFEITGTLGIGDNP